MKAKAPTGAQVERQRLGLVEQLLQRYVEQAFDIHPGQAHAQQTVGAAIGGNHLALLIKNQQPSPGAAEVVQAGVEAQLKVALLKQVEDQAVFHRLAHHLDHAQGVRGRQVAVAGHIQHRNHLPLLIKNRRCRAGHKAVGLEEVLIVLNMDGLSAAQGGADGVGAGIALQPGGPGDKAGGAARFDKTLVTPGLQHLALMVGQHDQAIGVRQDGAVVGQHFFMGGVHQGVLAFQQGADFAALGLVEDRGALVGQTVVTAAGPGVLDDGLVGQGSDSVSHDRSLARVLVVMGLGLRRVCAVSPKAVQCQRCDCSVVHCALFKSVQWCWGWLPKSTCSCFKSMVCRY